MFKMKKLNLQLLKNEKYKRNSILTMFFLTVLISFMSFNVFALSGSGTEADPILIYDEKDLIEMRQIINSNESWSKGKYFSLQRDITTAPSIDIYCFDGIFHGNGCTIIQNGILFGIVKKSGVIRDLTIGGKGYFADVNCGAIINCNCNIDDNSEAMYGIVRENKGCIQGCKTHGKFISGIVKSNYGKITRCIVDGVISSTGMNVDCHVGGGIACSNEKRGVISHCRVMSEVTGSAGLLYENKGLIYDCTINGTIKKVINKDKYNCFLISDNRKGWAIQCVVGKEAVEKSTTCKDLFCIIGNADECGFESSDI